MNVDIHGAPIYFETPILGGIKITASLVVTWGVMLVLTLVCIFLTHGMKVNNISKRQAIAEKIVLTAENFVRSNMGEAWNGHRSSPRSSRCPFSRVSRR